MSDAGLLRLRNLEQLERAAAVAGERFELAERAVGLEDLGAVAVGAEEEGAEHRVPMVGVLPDGLGATLRAGPEARRRGAGPS
jgi:hypothetical protein